MTTMQELTPELIQKIEDQIAIAKTLPGVKVELIGSWVWVSGNTKPVKDDLKAAEFKWNSKRKMWYYPTVKSRGNGAPIETIRAKYGSVTVKE